MQAKLRILDFFLLELDKIQAMSHLLFIFIQALKLPGYGLIFFKHIQIGCER